MDFGALTAGLLTGLREGVEAALILAIVLAYLVRSGNGAQAGKVWLGAGLAILVSVVAGVVIFNTAGELETPYEQYFEGTTLLIAAAIVTWMLFWMRRTSAGMRGELHARIDRAITEGTVLGLAVLAFTAVIREGIETSIFLPARRPPPRRRLSVLVGALIGLAIAVAIGWIFYTGSRRINLACSSSGPASPSSSSPRACSRRRSTSSSRSARSRSGRRRRSTSRASCRTSPVSASSCGRSSATAPRPRSRRSGCT